MYKRQFISEYLEIYEKYNHNISQKYLKSNFPNIYEEVVKFSNSVKWGEQQYMYIHNIQSRPLCPICGKEVGYINFTKGYKTFCSHKCNIVNNTHINTKSDYKKSDLYTKIDVYYKNTHSDYVIKNICSHGDITISKHKLDIVYSQYDLNKYPMIVCLECLEEYINNKDITINKQDIKKYISQNNIQNFNKNYLENRERLLYIMILKYNIPLKYNWDRLVKDITNNYCVDCGKESIYKRCDKCKQLYISEYISASSKKHFKLKRIKKYKNVNFDISVPNNQDNLVLKNVCTHGDITISKRIFNELYEMYNSELVHNTYIICDKCLENIDSESNQYDISVHGLTERQIRHFYPLIWKQINEHSVIDGLSFAQKKFLYVNKITELPKCKVCGINYVGIHKNNNKLLLTCSEHKYQLFRSNMEFELEEFIRDIYQGQIKVSYRYQHNKEIDLFIPEFNIGIEMNGLYWHNEFKKDRKYHYNKFTEINNSGIKLITIWEDDWNDEKKRSIIKSIIRNNLMQSFKIYARKCVVKEIDSKTASVFLEKNHIQGKINSSFRLGLFYNNDLVSVMTFGKQRMIMNSKGKDGYELLRFCNKLGYNIVGGASKLLTHFIRIINPHIIISYANCDISNGNVYEKLGFIKESHTLPNYWWVVNGTRHHRANYMKHKLIERGYDRNSTEVEIMHNLGHYRIFGNGSFKYILEIQ